MLQAQSTKAGETALAGAVEFFRGCWFGVWFFGGNCCDWGQDLLLGFQLEIQKIYLTKNGGSKTTPPLAIPIIRAQETGTCARIISRRVQLL